MKMRKSRRSFASASVAPRRRDPDAAVIATRAQRPKATDGLAQARSTGELREHHAEQLIHAGEAAEFLPAAVALDRRVEGAAWEQIEQLSEDRATRSHGRIVPPNHLPRSENRQTKLESCTLTSERSDSARSR